MDDLISRQAAIEVADAVWAVTGDKNVAKVWDQLKDLPSAEVTLCHLDSPCEYQNADIAMSSVQPKIVRCKDCAHYGNDCVLLFPADGYCYDGERRKG